MNVRDMTLGHIVLAIAAIATGQTATTLSPTELSEELDRREKLYLRYMEGRCENCLSSKHSVHICPGMGGPGPGPGPVTGGYEMSPKTYDKCDEKAHIFNGTENKGYCQCGKKHYLDPIEPVYGGSIPHPDGFGGEDFPAIKPDDTGKHLCAVHGWVDATVVRGDFVCRMCTPLRSVCGKPGLSGNATGQHVCGHEHDHVGLCGNWIWSEFKSSAQPADTDLVDAIAALCHEQWSGWLKYQFGLVAMQDESGQNRENYPQRWRRQMSTKYADLSEMEKESDRTEARKFVALLKERGALK